MDETAPIRPRGKQRAPSATAEPRSLLAPGSYAGEYLLKAVIASGGHGTVYEAEHRVLGRRAAVKLLQPQLLEHGDMLKRFVLEAQVVNRIRHPNIVDVYDFGLTAEGYPYYVMELLPGQPLSQVLRAQGRMSLARALSYLEPVCEALEAVHRAGVVHRDLKASNVAVVAEGPPPVVKLLDFGIAKFLHPEPGQEQLTVAGQRLGTSHVMAPEQLRGGTICPATDIYALGVMLYHLLTGSYPFHSEDPLEVERMHLEAPPPRPSALVPVPPAVDAVVLRCMEKEAQQRYPHVAAFLAALREAAAPHKASAAQASSVRAFALHVEVVPNGGQDDLAYATAFEALDGLEQELRGAGFLLAIQTGTMLLGVRPLEEASPVTAEELLTTARGLHARAQAQLSGSGAHVRVHTCVHVGPVEVRRGPEGLEVTGGAVTELAAWVGRGEDLVLTPEAARACGA